MKVHTYRALKALPLTPRQRSELARLKKLDLLVFQRTRQAYYAKAHQQADLLFWHYQLYLDPWERKHLRCLVCRKTWRWPVNRRSREAHRAQCTPRRATPPLPLRIIPWMFD